MDTTLMFRSIKWPGTEHLRLRSDSEDIDVDSVVVAFDERPLRLAYGIRCTAGWATRGLDITEASSGLDLHFRADGAGHWTDGDGIALSQLDGCIDVDIAATPFTNTLPIRRLSWEVGEQRNLRMLYFVVPELLFRPADQRYTCLARDAAGATFRYESEGFETDIRADSDGFVIDYPGIWRRVWPEVPRAAQVS
jgi:hypothetical protein